MTKNQAMAPQAEIKTVNQAYTPFLIMHHVHLSRVLR